MIDTINVLEMNEEDVLGLASYPNDIVGKGEAEGRFKTIAAENGLSEDEISEAVSNGHASSGTWNLYLVNSTEPK